jgi:hypothetical protein
MLLFGQKWAHLQPKSGKAEQQTLPTNWVQLNPNPQATSGYLCSKLLFFFKSCTFLEF